MGLHTGDITVITAAKAEGLDIGLLVEAAQSVIAASHGVCVRHLVMLDGGGPEDQRQVQDQLRGANVGGNIDVRRLPFRAGAGGARTAALTDVDTAYFTVLDADDLLPPGSIDVQMVALARHREARYAVGNFMVLHPDGTQTPYLHPFDGVIGKGDLVRQTRDTGVLPTSPVAAVWSSDMVRALGGWSALPRDEDTALKLSVSSIAAGVAVPEMVYIYRRGVPGQLTAASGFKEAGNLSRRVAYDRVRGLVGSGHADPDLVTGNWDKFLSGDTV
jgi:hypothetical protein